EPAASLNDRFHPYLQGQMRSLRRTAYLDATMRAPGSTGRQRVIPSRRRGSNSVSGFKSHRTLLRPLAIASRVCRSLIRAASQTTHHFLPWRCAGTGTGELRGEFLATRQYAQSRPGQLNRPPRSGSRVEEVVTAL